MIAKIHGDSWYLVSMAKCEGPVDSILLILSSQQGTIELSQVLSRFQWEKAMWVCWPKNNEDFKGHLSTYLVRIYLKKNLLSYVVILSLVLLLSFIVGISNFPPLYGIEFHFPHFFAIYILQGGGLWRLMGQGEIPSSLHFSFFCFLYIPSIILLPFPPSFFVSSWASFSVFLPCSQVCLPICPCFCSNHCFFPICSFLPPSAFWPLTIVLSSLLPHLLSFSWPHLSAFFRSLWRMVGEAVCQIRQTAASLFICLRWLLPSYYDEKLNWASQLAYAHRFTSVLYYG